MRLYAHEEQRVSFVALATQKLGNISPRLTTLELEVWNNNRGDDSKSDELVILKKFWADVDVSKGHSTVEDWGVGVYIPVPRSRYPKRPVCKAMDNDIVVYMWNYMLQISVR